MSLDHAAARLPDHPVDPQFPARWSPRSFSEATLTEGQVLTVLEAARWAPSASNNQPARFVWGLRGDAGFAAILGALVPSNRDWAQRAAALIAVASRDVTVAADGTVKPNRWAGFDSGAAWMSLALQAQAMGLVAHAMGGFDGPALSAAVALPADHSLHAVVAIGQQGPVENLPEALRAREAPNQRNPLTASAFRGRF
ncbi:MAG: nitroreductase family protein [Rhodobacteraceae bacterium]|nr:nitroreductase family protein [Paracoccaceae bacterium]